MSGALPRPVLMPGQFLGPGIAPGISTPDIFANQLRLGVTLTDFTLVFGVSEESPAGAVTRDRAIIRLAPGMVKQLVAHLEMIVSAYEEAIAPIPVQARLNDHLVMIRQTLLSTLRERLAGPTDAEMASSAPRT